MDLMIKTVHIFSAILLFGTGFGSAFYKFMADRSGDLPAMARINRLVVQADWWFTAPTVIIQPTSGLYLLTVNGYPLNTPWILLSVSLFVFAGCAWLRVLWLQYQMRKLTVLAMEQELCLGAQYVKYQKQWTLLGVIAFFAISFVTILMVIKPKF